MKISEHFTKAELEQSNTAIRKGLSNVAPDSLIANMKFVCERIEIIRAHFGLPIECLSCYRSDEVNDAVGGSSSSAHTKAMAMDLRIKGVSVFKICKWAAENLVDFDQIIYEFGEDGWCHIGFTHGKPRKQVLTAAKVEGKTKYKVGLFG